MTKSSINKEPVMGRADILLRFLQLISKDSPKDIDPYLTDLDDDTEQRPLVDQIIDRIISGDSKLYKQYAQARREIGTRNPYTSQDDSEEQTKQERALGFFMSKWIGFETTLRKLAEHKQFYDKKARYSPAIAPLIRMLDIPDETLHQILAVRNLRNQAVHGIELPEAEELIEAGKVIEQVVGKLREELPDKGKKALRQRKTYSRTKTSA